MQLIILLVADIFLIFTSRIYCSVLSHFHSLLLKCSKSRQHYKILSKNLHQCPGQQRRFHLMKQNTCFTCKNKCSYRMKWGWDKRETQNNEPQIEQSRVDGDDDDDDHHGESFFMFRICRSHCCCSTSHSPSPCLLNCNNSGIQCLPSFFISSQFGPDEFMSCAKVFILLVLGLVSISYGYATNPATCFC